jgi:hypothetical protein
MDLGFINFLIFVPTLLSLSNSIIAIDKDQFEWSVNVRY